MKNFLGKKNFPSKIFSLFYCFLVVNMKQTTLTGIGITLALLWHCIALSLHCIVIALHCIGIAIALAMHWHYIALALHWHYIALALHWHYIGITLHWL